jgi:molybdenum cofactor synthesis domain-containing protein
VKISAAILTISDSCHKGLRQDASGPRLRVVLADAGFEVKTCKIVPDDVERIASTLRELSGEARFIVTTGGTGIASRDVTPEATRAVCERIIDGVAELMRREGVKHTPFAALSRGVCATLGKSLVLNLPGSPAGAEQSLRTVLPLVPHALDLLAGKTEHSGSN